MVGQRSLQAPGAAAVTPGSSFTDLKDAVFLPDSEIPKSILFQGFHLILAYSL